MSLKKVFVAYDYISHKHVDTDRRGRSMPDISNLVKDMNSFDVILKDWFCFQIAFNKLCTFPIRLYCFF